MNAQRLSRWGEGKVDLLLLTLGALPVCLSPESMVFHAHLFPLNVSDAERGFMCGARGQG